MTLTDSVLLSRAIEVQKRCYNFLQLTRNDQLHLSGGWSIGNFHNYSTNETERFRELILANLLTLPDNSRPISACDADIDEFANFFISYLFCSFDIVTNSASRRIQLSEQITADSCWCELCSRLTNAPNLKLKKVTSRDKAIANSLEFEAVRNLISVQNISIQKKEVNQILADPKLIESRALLAYGIELIRRCKGEYVDTSSLVLWRRFAWDEKGIPKKDFVLKTDIIEEAETQLISRLRNFSL